MQGKSVKVRCTTAFTDAGHNMRSKWEQSSDGSSWETFWDVKASKVPMNHKVGVWIDHKKAVIVSASGDRVTAETLESDVGPHTRYSGPQDGGGEDVFCHHTAIAMEGFRTLAEGQKVSFDLTKGPKGLQAQNVRAA